MTCHRWLNYNYIFATKVNVMVTFLKLLEYIFGYDITYLVAKRCPSYTLQYWHFDSFKIFLRLILWQTSWVVIFRNSQIALSKQSNSNYMDNQISRITIWSHSYTIPQKSKRLWSRFRKSLVYYIISRLSMWVTYLFLFTSH